ncbi:MAG: response regulator transcription factor [Dehalococcoidia bacterium]|nr:response regulator transcription factor [Dehalococcoidia bacterium]MCA9850180.1 response regulator transcription factor [Dehalococcoidia bacterium]MCA9857572.1 response regulator transcription factor [Dehalococcoidia bacterium]MCB9491640.1 response regulator transcription factor [Dehalococcoidia bacterium]
MNILLVDDDQSLVRVLRQGLVAEGFTVSAAHDGAEGLRLAAGPEFDLIVLDVMLPEMDGQEILRALRADGVTTPVLLLTARDAVSDRVSGLEAGADDYLTKPFAFDELLARIRALHRRAALAQPDVLQVGEVTMDRASHEVRVQGRRIDLTPTEYRLLELLMQNVGKLLSRQTILARVWGYDIEVAPNAVEQYVHYLRSKLADALQVTTVRGAGYRLDVP